MSAQWLQTLLVALVVGASAGYVIWRALAPRLVGWRLQQSLRLDRNGRSPLARWLGRRLAPPVSSGGCSDGCSSCSGCGTTRGVSAGH